MGYSSDILKKASDIMSQRHNEALRNAERQKDYAYAHSKRIREIDEELASIGACASKAVLMGKNSGDILRSFKEKSLALQEELSAELFRIGLTRDDLLPQFKCKKCRDTGFFDKDGKTVICDCLKKLRGEIAAEELNSISPLALSGFESFDLSRYSMDEGEYKIAPYKRMSNIYKFCREYADSFDENSGSLFMRGATGLGKTHLSLAIANEVIKKGYGVVYVSAPAILSKLEKAHFVYGRKDADDSEEEIMSVLTTCDLLIIDDIGTEFSSPYSNAAVYNIFNTRILSGKPIIFSTNLTLKELSEIYSDRFVSRIVGLFTKLDFIGHDLRLPQK